jgi:hypothetical protein
MTLPAFIANTRRKQTAYEVTGCQVQVAAPIIGLSALLQLTSWIEQQRQSLQGGEACSARSGDQSPPPTTDARQSRPQKHPWQEVPTETRRKALLTLSRLIARHLLAARVAEEVAHEQH